MEEIQMKKKMNKVVLLLALATVIYGVYYLFFKKDYLDELLADEDFDDFDDYVDPELD